MHRVFIVVALLLTLSPAKGAGVSDERYAKLARGVNLSHWFAQSKGKDYSRQHFETWIKAEDFKRIADLGFTHVRLPLDPEVLITHEGPDHFDAERFAMLMAALKMASDSGLAVVLDAHPTDQFKMGLKNSDTAVANFSRYWAELAKRLAKTDPEMVFLEVLNEPLLSDAPRWNRVQGELIKVIREQAPKHTLVVCPDKWSDVTFLEALPLYDDTNLIYNFHCYTPTTFTHQGATWGTQLWQFLHDVPYPSTPENVADVAATITDRGAKAALIDYGAKHWDAAKVGASANRGGDWARQHEVRVTCNEFGVLRKAPAEGRLAYLHDLVTALERNHIGWTMWDYAGGFGICTTDAGGGRVLDRAAVEALGLKVP